MLPPACDFVRSRHLGRRCHYSSVDTDRIPYFHFLLFKSASFPVGNLIASSRLLAERHVKVNTDGGWADDRQKVKQNDETTQTIQKCVEREEILVFFLPSAAEKMHNVSLLWHKYAVQGERNI